MVRMTVVVTAMAGTLMVAGCGSGTGQAAAPPKSTPTPSVSSVPTLRPPTPTVRPSKTPTKGAKPSRPARHRQRPSTSVPYTFDGHGADVSAARFGALWPLTVQSGRVNCIPVVGHRVIVEFTRDNRMSYWLNDVGRQEAGAFDLKSPGPIMLPGHADGFGVLQHVCDPVAK